MVLVIGKNCIFKYRALQRVEFEAGSQVASIGISEFKKCGALESLVMPPSVELIYFRSFAKCAKSPSVKFEARSQIREISHDTFSDDLLLQSIPIPAFAKPGSECVMGCYSFASVAFDVRFSGWILGVRAPASCNSLQWICIPGSVMAIAEWSSGVDRFSLRERLGSPSSRSANGRRVAMTHPSRGCGEVPPETVLCLRRHVIRCRP